MAPFFSLTVDIILPKPSLGLLFREFALMAFFFGASFLCFVKIAWVKFCNTKFKLKINIKFLFAEILKCVFFLIDEEYYLKIPFKYGYLCYLKKIDNFHKIFLFLSIDFKIWQKQADNKSLF